MENGENGLLMVHVRRHVEVEQRPEHDHAIIRLLDMVAKLVPGTGTASKKCNTKNMSKYVLEFYMVLDSIW